MNLMSNQHQIFADSFFAQVSARPQATAVRYRGEMVSFEMLYCYTTALAEKLHQLRCYQRQAIGVCLDRSPEWLAGMMAINHLGCLYVPLDPAFPMERLARIIEANRINVVLAHPSYVDNLVSLGIEVVSVERERLATGVRVPPRPSENEPENCLAYIMPTSGSTGTPKHVMVKNSSVSNYLFSLITENSLDSEDITIQVAPISVDASIRDSVCPIISGGQLLILSESDQKDPRVFAEAVLANSVTSILAITPTFLRQVLYWIRQNIQRDTSIMENCALKRIIVSGEPLSSSLVKMGYEVFGRDLKIINHYGPTECTMTCCSYLVPFDLDDDGVVPIGQPFAGAEIYILDENMRPVPGGDIGEICVTGPGVSDGYLDQPTSTSNSFVSSPLVEQERMYRTGDLGICRPHDRNILFVGRRDRQVKIRGNRVELEDVESALHSHSSVQLAAVIANKGNSKALRLTAFVVLLNQAALDFDESEFKVFLASRVPSYMVPYEIVFLETLPLTRYGKIDRRKLEEMVLLPDTIPHVSEHDLQMQLTQLWYQTIHKMPESIDQNFFLSGGESISAMELVASIQHKMGKRISLSEIFDNPTIRGIINLLKND